MVSLILGVVTIVLILIGVPIAFCLGIGSSAAIIVMNDIPLQVIPQKLFKGMDSFPLLCIPFFIFAGDLMSQGKITEKILNFAVLIVGRIRGGLAMANVLASMFFGGMTGSAIADTSALGSVEIPMMIKAGYDRKFSAAITSASAVIGPIIPPSIPIVLYSVAVGTSIGGLFLAGIIPGVIIGISLIIGCYVIACKRSYPITEEKLTLYKMLEAFRKVFLAILLPFIVVGGIVSGIFTPTEASAVAVVYAFIVTVIITKTICLKDLPKMLIDSSITTAIVMIIAGTGTLWGWVVAIEQWGLYLGMFLEQFGPIGFLILVNIFLLILGTFMDNIPIILIFAPALAPIATNLGIDPLHFGMIVVLNTTIGLITPPLGCVLFIAGPLAKISIEDLSKEIFVLFLILAAALILITYSPFTTLWVPRMFGF